MLIYLGKATKDIPNVSIKPFDGLSVDFARENQAQFIVRGLRAITDFEYELQMAQTNRVLDPDIDTIFLTTSLEYAYLSSTISEGSGLLMAETMSKLVARQQIVSGITHETYRKNERK